MSLKVPFITIFIISLLSIGGLAFEYLPWWNTNSGNTSIEQTLEKSSKKIETYAKAITIASRQGDTQTVTLAVNRLNSELPKYQDLVQTRTTVFLGIFKLILNIVFLFGVWIYWTKYNKPLN